MNSPIEGSKVYPLTSFLVAMTIWVEEPYKQYPAEIKSSPHCKKSSGYTAEPIGVFLFQIAKIEPLLNNVNIITIILKKTDVFIYFWFESIFVILN